VLWSKPEDAYLIYFGGNWVVLSFRDGSQDPVLDKDLTAPPGGESIGDRYIVGASATGAWSGKDDDIAQYDGAGWFFKTPIDGTTVSVADEDEIYLYNGSAWVKKTSGTPAGIQTYIGQLSAATSGGSWSVSTGALGFTPKMALVHWRLPAAGSTTTYGWGFAKGTGTSNQMGMSVYRTADGSIDANDIMGYDNTAGGATAFGTERAAVTAFGSSNVTIATQTGAWAEGTTVLVNVFIIGE
jgi:hypothetical protein